MTIHTPVLTKEVLEYLDPKPNENIIDGTIGEAGHALLILEKNKPNGKVLGIDQDCNQIENSTSELANVKERVLLVCDSYIHIKNVVEKTHFAPVQGILLDLGYSSWHIEKSQKGFSFLRNEPLDMRYDKDNPLTAEKIVNDYSERDIKEIIESYGEERFAKKIAKEIVLQRKKERIQTTFALNSIVEKCIPGKFKHGKIHSSTRVFQALRIAVNGELDAIRKVLPEALAILSPGGRLVVISFHSLEDRIIKDFFKQQSQLKTLAILTKKPIVASSDEMVQNPRARSAKLRAIVKL